MLTLPADKFGREFEVVLANDDFLNALMLRRRVLIEDKAVRFRGKTVLELGAHTGGFSQSIATWSKRLTALENNPRCVSILRRKLRDGASVIRGDVHHTLWRLRPRAFDIVVCAGLLYHSASPFSILEGMVRLQPQMILIDTLNAGVERDAAHLQYERLVNAVNFRYNTFPDCGFTLNLGDKVIIEVLKRLGFDLVDRVRKAHLRLPASMDSPYFRNWRRSFTGWFVRRAPV